MVKVEFPRYLRKYVDPKSPRGEIVFKVRNSSVNQVDLELTVDRTPSYTKLTGQTALTFQLKSQEEKQIDIPFDLGPVNTRMAEIKVDVRYGLCKQEMILCEIYPIPKLELRSDVVCGEFRIFVAEGKPASMQLPVVVRYAPLTVTKVVVGGKQLAENCNPVCLGVGAGELPVIIPPGMDGNVQLEIYGEEIEEPFQVTINLLRQEPPRVTLCQTLPTPDNDVVEKEGDSLVLSMFPGETEKVWEFKIVNHSEFVLKFEAIAPNMPRSDHLRLKVLDPIGPFDLQPGGTVLVRVELELDENAKSQGSLKNYEFYLNCSVEDLQGFNGRLGPFAILLTVEELKPYPDPIALDFGTSTCTAVCNDGPIRLEGTDTKILSNILIQNYDEQSKTFTYLIGEKAKELGRTKEMRHCLVKAVKLKINDPNYKEISLPLARRPKVTPDELAKLIFLDIFLRIQRQIRGKPNRVILGLPTRFSPDQRKRIVNACKSSWDLERIDTIDESVAVGLFYILGRGLVDFREKTYKMMVIDFGGGTTDVTVFSVTNSASTTSEEGKVDKIEIKASWGDTTLGGEILTRNIAEVLAEKFIRKLSHSTTGQCRMDKNEIIRNLEDEAEEAKVLIAEADSWLGEEVPGDVSRDQAKNRAEEFMRQRLLSQDFEARFRHIQSALFSGKSNDEIVLELAKLLSDGKVTVFSKDYPSIQDGVELSYDEIITVFEGYIRPFLDELKIMLKKVGVPMLDIVLLAGQSCRFDKVRDWIEERGFADRVELVKDFSGNPVLKESVARGAFLYSYYIPSIVQLEGANRCWRRLGIRIGEKFVEILGFGANPGVEAEFDWVRTEETLSIYEHPRLEGNDAARAKKFKEFALPGDIPFNTKSKSKIRLEEDGSISLWYLSSEHKWIKLEPMGG